MADAKTRKQRLRQRRQQAGLKAALVWLSPEGQAAMAALGYAIRSTKTRSAARFVVCTDSRGEVERYGLFELQPSAQEGDR
jgi:hypothetical protein